MNMKQVRLPQFHDRAESVWAQFLQALPVIVFFLIMFYSVIFFYQRYIEGEPELSSLMTRYARNLSRLYVLVLRRVR